MTSKFKIGDRVKNKSGRKFSNESEIVTIEKLEHLYGHDRAWFKETKTHSPLVNLEVVKTHFPLYSEAAAVSLLEEKGYVVTPPPEPLKGKVVLYRVEKSKTIYAKDKSLWDQQKLGIMPHISIVAIVDWVEGEGI